MIEILKQEGEGYLETLCQYPNCHVRIRQTREATFLYLNREQSWTSMWHRELEVDGRDLRDAILSRGIIPPTHHRLAQLL